MEANDPRNSSDPHVKSALAVWDAAKRQPKKAWEDATRIRDELYQTSSHQAFGWASLSCGRLAAYKGDAEQAEAFLTEALGRFAFARDRYGEAIANSFLSIPLSSRAANDRALEYALRPFSVGLTFTSSDLDLLHNNAAKAYWGVDDLHSAMAHLVKANNLVKAMGDVDRQAVVLSNIGVILIELAEFELALKAFTQSWKLELSVREQRDHVRYSHLTNILWAHYELRNNESIPEIAESMFGYLKSGQCEGNFIYYAILCEAFAFIGQIERSEYCLEVAKKFAARRENPVNEAIANIAQATIYEAKKEYYSAISTVNMVIAMPRNRVYMNSHRGAANVLARCYAAIGNVHESSKWKMYVAQIGSEYFLDSFVSSQVSASLEPHETFQPLSARELECLDLIARGQTSGDIGVKLGVTTRTVNYHVSNILRKLNSANRQEAVAKAIAAGLLRRN